MGGGGRRWGREEAYFTELIRVDDETAAFFRNVLHGCDPRGEVVGVWGDVDSGNLNWWTLRWGRRVEIGTYSMPF